MPEAVLIGTRGSALALAQARLIAAALGNAELVILSTRGDRTAGPLTQIGGKGLFTEDLEAALRAGRVHLAVHSAKDLPAELAGDMVIAAVPPREDARDALVSPAGWGLGDLPPGARVGTSSFRRSGQLLARRPDVQILPLRGNVDTRIRKLREGQFDAVIVAMAGLKRLGLLGELGPMVRPLEIIGFLPAAGQGALAVQCLAQDMNLRRRLESLDDPPSSQALFAERELVGRLGADCHSAVGVYIAPVQAGWAGQAIVTTAAGRPMIRSRADAASAAQVSRALCDDLLAQGAARLLSGGTFS